jgi:hypothetical protein
LLAGFASALLLTAVLMQKPVGASDLLDPTPLPTTASPRTDTPAAPSPSAVASASLTVTDALSPTAVSPEATQTFTPRPPTRTPTSTPSPTPDVDFRLVSWRLWPLALNGGCEQGMHNIFVVVLDVNGQPLSNIVVGDTYNNVEDVTGRPGKEPGRIDIPLYANTMEIIVKRDAVTGQTFTSQASPPCSSFITTIPDEQLVQAGYFVNELEAQWNRQNFGYKCGGHFSWEVIFQRTH